MHSVPKRTSLKSWFKTGNKIPQIVSVLLLLIASGFKLPAHGSQIERLGVFRSQDNISYWSDITNRLQGTGINYCTIDLTNASENFTLTEVDVLLIPNVEVLTGAHLNALQSWINNGGRLIVTGPIGSSSQPQVRSQLRSLLGAYWGFALPTPSTLSPLKVKQQLWVQQSGLSSTLRGGVIIPAGLNSHAAAVWLADGTPPAVVVTERSTFLGWRWGVNTASPAGVDIAWLKTALNRYGEFTTVRGPTGRSCNETTSPPPPKNTLSEVPISDIPSSPALAPLELQPISVSPSSDTDLSSPRTPNANPNPETVAVAPTPINLGQPDNAITSEQVKAMGEELTNLMGRFESALLAAATIDNQVGLLTSEAIAQFQNRGSQRTNSLNGNPILQEARRGLQNFHKLIEQQQYDQARLEWHHARRLLWDNYPTDRPLAQPEIRAIWLDRKTIVNTRSEAELAIIFDRIAASGINTVFFETLNASYPIYPSQVAPVQNPATQGWDPLKAAVKLAHERGMELHAWVWLFAAANQRHNVILNQPRDYLGPVLTQHPDWVNRNNRGNTFHPNTRKAFLDPGNPEVQQYLLSILTEIATQYDVDGIQFDYVRYPFQNPTKLSYGYGVASRQAFQKLTGVDPITLTPRHSLWSQWTNFRIQQIDNFVATASQTLRSHRSDLILSAAVFAIPQAERLAQLQQNWETWAQNGDIDLLIPMTYATNSQQLEQITQPLFNSQAIGSTLLLPGIRLLNIPEIVAVDQVQLIRNLPTEGYALFAAENLTLTLQNILNRTQTSSRQPLPYRQPFQVATARYQGLQREWRWVLSNHQFSMEQETLEEWGKQVNILGVALEKLATQPSQRTLLSTQTALTSFRRQFPQWMQRHAQTNPYQVQVWENRLASLEKLLLYGERTINDQQFTMNDQQ